jgi:hypothetical protein
VGFDDQVDSVFAMSAKFKTKAQSNGRENAGASGTPISVRPAHDRAVAEMAVVDYGARLAAKLQTKIILNDTEFNHPGEMSVDDRRLYHEALAALFPPGIAIHAGEPPKVRQKKGLLIGLVVGVLAVAVYFWLRGVFG